MKQRRKAGVTLVELMVVVAIMAVLMTFTTYGISTLTGARGKDCSTKISTALEETRVYAMSHNGDYSVSLYIDDDGYVIVDSYKGTEKAGKYGVKVTYQITGSSEEVELGDKDHAITFSFKQNTGAFTGLTYDYVNVYANNYVFRMRLYKTTGKVVINKEYVS